LDREIRKAPGVTLHVMPTRRDEPALLRDGAIDLAIGVYDYAPYSDLPSELRTQFLYEDDFACVVRADHPTVGRAAARPRRARARAVLDRAAVAPAARWRRRPSLAARARRRGGEAGQSCPRIVLTAAACFLRMRLSAGSGAVAGGGAVGFALGASSA